MTACHNTRVQRAWPVNVTVAISEGNRRAAAFVGVGDPRR